MTLAVDLKAIRLRTRHRRPPALVEDVAFAVPNGATLGIVGESGSGKSLTAQAIMGLLPPSLEAEGQVALDGADLLGLPERDLQRVRGARIGMIFQEPMTALNPAMRVGDQIAEGLLRHRPTGRAQARAEALRLLDRVRIPEARRRLDAFPHELSGGQRQRVCLAIAIAPGPRLLIADEPTTALDVTVQAEVLGLLGELVTDLRMALLLISHDLGVIGSICERTLVMNAGRVAEAGDTAQVLRRPAQAHTRRLVAALPKRATHAGPAAPPAAQPLLDVRHLEREYRSHTGRAVLKAVDGVSFTVEAGTIFGIVGESGCGKSTLARMIMGLDRPTGGRILFEGHDVGASAPAALRGLRRGFQMVFQDPQGSLDPRQRVRRIVAEPLALDPRAPRGAALRALVGQTLAAVGLAPSDADRFPHEFSGGQRQRIAIARAIIGRPKLIVADEPVSALDPSVQAQVLDLLTRLRQTTGIAVVLISHSLAVVQSICDRVAVMSRGRFVEVGSTAQIFDRPTDPCTRRLIDAELRIDQPRRYGLAPDHRAPALGVPAA